VNNGLVTNVVSAREKGANMLGTILIVILILALFGALPRWSHSRDWGYYPSGGVGLVLMIVVILLVLGRI
jgi:FtsH-binding integral membrane protein